MRLHHRLLNGGLLLFVVMLGAYSEANPPPGNGGAALRPLLGAWQFITWIKGEKYQDIVFIDEVRTKQMPNRPTPSYFVKGFTVFGSPLIGHDQQADFPDQRVPFQYAISWKEPPGTKQSLVYEFNFLSPDRVGGVSWMIRGDKKTPARQIIGIRVCHTRNHQCDVRIDRLMQ